MKRGLFRTLEHPEFSPKDRAVCHCCHPASDEDTILSPSDEQQTPLRRSVRLRTTLTPLKSHTSGLYFSSTDSVRRSPLVIRPSSSSESRRLPVTLPRPKSAGSSPSLLHRRMLPQVPASKTRAVEIDTPIAGFFTPRRSPRLAVKSPSSSCHRTYPRTILSPAATPSPKSRRVNFEAVEVRSYKRRHGGSLGRPSLGGIGYALGLGWDYEPDPVLSSVSEYENKRESENRRSSANLKPLSQKERRSLLKEHVSPNSSRREAAGIWCRCQKGCDSRLCTCFKNGEGCLENFCLCAGCHNPLN